MSVTAGDGATDSAFLITTTGQGEPLQLLRYGPGGEFKPHHDAEKEGGNQRILTGLVYLSDDYDGGETQFTRTDFSFRGRKGDILLFSNVRADGRPDPLAGSPEPNNPSCPRSTRGFRRKRRTR